MTKEKFIIYDDVLPSDIFKKISEDIIGNGSIPWYYTKNVSNNGIEKVCYFTHLFYYYEHFTPQKSNWYDLLIPILEVLNCKSLIRIKGNIYPSTRHIY